MPEVVLRLLLPLDDGFEEVCGYSKYPIFAGAVVGF